MTTKPALTTLRLVEKRQLTADIFELVYLDEQGILSMQPPKPGQYVMFRLAPGLNRAYSFVGIHENTCTLLIKRIPEGKGSTILCDAAIGDTFSGMLPLGHFVLQETPENKCFIGTGTGIAPLYFQAIATHQQQFCSQMTCIFGTRTQADAVYQPELQAIFQKNPTGYIQYFSQEISSDCTHKKGYVTNWITRENIAPYTEFYLCGSPQMVTFARKKLELLGIQKEQIFWEQY